MMKKTLLPLVAIFISSTNVSCQKVYKISFECEHCTYSGENVINTKKEYNASFNIEWGYELKFENIEVINKDILDNNCWTFMYQNNIINSFKIKPHSINGDVKVKIKASKKNLKEYGCAVDVDDVDQSSILFLPTQKEFKYISDWQRNAYQIYEDEMLDFTFKAKESKTIPSNIGMWMNGRYAKENSEVFFHYSFDMKSCHVHVPNYVARDNLQFRLM